MKYTGEKQCPNTFARPCSSLVLSDVVGWFSKCMQYPGFLVIPDSSCLYQVRRRKPSCFSMTLPNCLSDMPGHPSSRSSIREVCCSGWTQTGLCAGGNRPERSDLCCLIRWLGDCGPVLTLNVTFYKTLSYLGKSRTESAGFAFWAHYAGFWQSLSVSDLPK